jgi:hypothetical protein
MPFLAGFDNDIFISYSHVDNLGDHWVERFQNELEIALARRIGRVGIVKIWRDKRLEGNQLFDETIRNAVEKAAVFIAITSNGYLASDYCRQELSWFSKKATGESYGLQIGDRSRIYSVLAAAIQPAQWPAEFGRISGYAFHNAKDADDLGEPTDPELDKLRYKEQLKAVADSLHRMLLAFKERIDVATVPQQAQTIGNPGGPTVFVAAVADSLSSFRKRIAVELERKGVSVEAGIPPPYPAAEHEQRVAAAAKLASLSVHLLDQLPGREIDGDPGSSYPQKQVQVVAAERRPQLIWIPKALDLASIEEEGYRQFLDQLENGHRKDAQYEFVRGAGPLVATQILERLAQLQSGPAPVPPRGVLLDTHLKDQMFAFEISKLLLTNNVQPYINPQEDDPGKNLDAFEARLAQVSSLAIVYGSVTESWVRQRLGVALQMSIAKNLPIKSFSVVLVPPPKQDRALTFSVGAITVGLIDNSGSATVNPSLFAGLLAPAAGRPA